MIHCVWYPSGGFGHFINAILTLHGVKFIRPTKPLNFGDDGNSHDLDLVSKKFFMNPETYEETFSDEWNYCVLIDNGINDESRDFMRHFPNAKVLKVCYSDLTWPIVAKTMIVKSMGKDISSEVNVGEGWNSVEDWSLREKYFLYLRDHKLRSAWRPNESIPFIFIDNLLKYDVMVERISLFADVGDFHTLWEEWGRANKPYLEPIAIAKRVILAVRTLQHIDISDIKDIWIQSVIYYYIWLDFGLEVPHNDYAKWFTNTQDIVTMLELLGVKIDSH